MEQQIWKYIPLDKMPVLLTWRSTPLIKVSPSIFFHVLTSFGGIASPEASLLSFSFVFRTFKALFPLTALSLVLSDASGLSFTPVRIAFSTFCSVFSALQN